MFNIMNVVKKTTNTKKTSLTFLKILDEIALESLSRSNSIDMSNFSDFPILAYLLQRGYGQRDLIDPKNLKLNSLKNYIKKRLYDYKEFRRYNKYSVVMNPLKSALYFEKYFEDVNDIIDMKEEKNSISILAKNFDNKCVALLMNYLRYFQLEDVSSDILELFNDVLANKVIYTNKTDVTTFIKLCLLNLYRPENNKISDNIEVVVTPNDIAFLEKNTELFMIPFEECKLSPQSEITYIKNKIDSTSMYLKQYFVELDESHLLIKHKDVTIMEYVFLKPSYYNMKKVYSSNCFCSINLEPDNFIIGVWFTSQLALTEKPIDLHIKKNRLEFIPNENSEFLYKPKSKEIGFIGFSLKEVDWDHFFPVKNIAFKERNIFELELYNTFNKKIVNFEKEIILIQ